ncbi:MAG TPA: RsmE family RNA methyltransferase, partial [Bacilli bacterium]
EAEIRELRDHEVYCKVIERRQADGEPKHRVWIAQGLPKADKMETVVQKCTELGAARFIPFSSSRTVVRYDEKQAAKRVERWRKIAKEAAEQAHRGKIPEIASPVTWPELVKLAAKADIAFLLYEQTRHASFKAALRRALAAFGPADRALDVLIVTGPEGGIAPEEALSAQNAGFIPVGLGNRILRTETAAMAALTCFLYETDEMGG